MATAQQLDAITKGNRNRLLQAELKRSLARQSIHEGKAVARGVIANPAPEVASMRLEKLLGAIARVGPEKVAAYCRLARVPRHRRLRELSDHERLRLDLVLR